MAYMVGLLTADGCLSKDGRHIDFTTKDLQLAQLYKSFNFPTNMIGAKHNGRSGKYYRVEVSDVALYDFLLIAGLTPNKSLTINAVNVPDVYFHHFLRGLFDGDGSISGYFDSRWRNSFMYYTTFVSASPPFIDWLRNQIYTYLPGIASSIRHSKDTSVVSLAYAKESSKILFHYMYEDGNVPKLERKYKRYLDLFAIDPYN